MKILASILNGDRIRKENRVNGSINISDLDSIVSALPDYPGIEGEVISSKNSGTKSNSLEIGIKDILLVLMKMIQFLL